MDNGWGTAENVDYLWNVDLVNVEDSNNNNEPNPFNSFDNQFEDQAELVDEKKENDTACSSSPCQYNSTPMETNKGVEAKVERQELSSEANAVRRMTRAEKDVLFDNQVMLFFGDREPSLELRDYDQTLPNWDELRDPFSYETPEKLRIDGILYYVNYVKLERDGRETYFKMMVNPKEEAMESANLKLVFNNVVICYTFYTEIRLSLRQEWIWHRILSDSSSLFLVCPRNPLVICKK